MADVSDADPNAEPSMEEILASIRRIIADEKDPSEEASAEPPAEEEDALELTQMVQEDGSVVDVKDEQEEAPAVEVQPEPEPEPVPEPEIAPEPALEMTEEEDNLVSDNASSEAASSLASLESTVQIERAASMPKSFTPLGDGERTLEEMVLQLMKPMLKEWLDANLPAIVDRLVQKEVERIARKASE